MQLMFAILTAAAEAEEQINVTPIMLRFIGKFFLIFAAVALIAVLTPRMAKKVDEFRARHEKPKPPEDPRCAQVKGPYDMPEPKPQKEEPEEEQKP